MADIQHSALTDPNIHEPKGITTALAGQVYIADGSNSGDWSFPAGHAYSEIYISEGVTTQTLAASSAKAILNPTAEWTSNGSKNVTQTPASGTLTVLAAGEYALNFWITFTTAAIASGAKYRFYYSVNGTSGTRNVYCAKTTNGVETHSLSSSGIVALAVNDILSIHVAGDATSSGTNITPVEAGFHVQLIEPA